MSSYEKPIKFYTILLKSTHNAISKYDNSCKNHNEIEKVYTKIKKNGLIEGDSNKLLISKEIFLYYKIYKDTTHLSVISKDMSDYKAFEMMDKINKIINSEKDNSIEVNKIIEEHQDITQSDIIRSIDIEVKEVNDIMKKNIRDVVNSTEKAKELEMNSSKINDLSKDFYNNSVELKRVAWWKNFKLWLIIFIAITLLVVVIVVPIFT